MPGETVRAADVLRRERLVRVLSDWFFRYWGRSKPGDATLTALTYVGHDGTVEPLSQPTFPAGADLLRASKVEGIDMRKLMAAALRDGDSPALDELLAIAKRTRVEN